MRASAASRIRCALSATCLLGLTATGLSAHEAASPEPYHSAFQQRRQHRDVAEDVRRVRGRLSAAEREQARVLVAEGDALSESLWRTADEDHVTAEAQVARLQQVRAELLALWEASRRPRGRGHAFVPAARTAHGWTDLGVTDGRLSVLRTRFHSPEAAYVTVRNDGPEPQPASVTLVFHDAVGEPTGQASVATEAGQPLQPGEVRELLAFIDRDHDAFWDVTRSYEPSLE